MNGRIFIQMKQKVDRVVISKEESDNLTNTVDKGYDALVDKHGALQKKYDKLLKQHNELRENAKKLITEKFDDVIPDDPTFKCDLCDKVLNTRTALNYHYRSKRHLKKVEDIVEKNEKHPNCESCHVRLIVRNAK